MAIIRYVQAARLDEQNGLATRLARLVNPRHQCAWCGRYIRPLDHPHSGAAYGRAYPLRPHSASHGICHDCAATVRAVNHLNHLNHLASTTPATGGPQ